MNRRLTYFFLPFFLYISTFTCEDYKNKSPGNINIEADKNKSQPLLHRGGHIYIYCFDYYPTGLWVWGDLPSGQDIHRYICLIWFHTIANEIRISGRKTLPGFRCGMWKYLLFLILSYDMSVPGLKSGDDLHVYRLRCKTNDGDLFKRWLPHTLSQSDTYLPLSGLKTDITIGLSILRRIMISIHLCVFLFILQR